MWPKLKLLLAFPFFLVGGTALCYINLLSFLTTFSIFLHAPKALFVWGLWAILLLLCLLPIFLGLRVGGWKNGLAPVGWVLIVLGACDFLFLLSPSYVSFCRLQGFLEPEPHRFADHRFGMTFWAAMILAGWWLMRKGAQKRRDRVASPRHG